MIEVLDKQLLFWLVPKTGTTSLERGLGANNRIATHGKHKAPIGVVKRHLLDEFRRCRVDNNSSDAECLHWLDIGWTKQFGAPYSDYDSVAFVRNPWERSWSWWCHIYMSRSAWNEHFEMGSDRAFETAADWMSLNLFNSNGAKRPFGQGELYGAWTRFATHVFRYEDGLWKQANKMLAQNGANPLSHERHWAHQTNDVRPHYHKFFDSVYGEQVKSLIAQEFAPEIERYGYDYENCVLGAEIPRNNLAPSNV
jgi:hypothetical protein